MDESILKEPQKPAGPVKVKEIYIQVDHDICIGSAICMVKAPKVFILDEMGQSVILASADDEEELTIMKAAEGCPMNAITILDEERKQIYPK